MVKKSCARNECQFCGRTFAYPSYLQKHIVVHTGEKPFQCDICGKAFSQRGNLNIHTRTHNNAKPFPCKTCQKRFSRREHAKRHELTHTRIKPFKCDVCGRSFGRKYHLNRHILTHSKSNDEEVSSDSKQTDDSESKVNEACAHRKNSVTLTDIDEVDSAPVESVAALSTRDSQFDPTHSKTTRQVDPRLASTYNWFILPSFLSSNRQPMSSVHPDVLMQSVLLGSVDITALSPEACRAIADRDDVIDGLMCLETTDVGGVNSPRRLAGRVLDVVEVLSGQKDAIERKRALNRVLVSNSSPFVTPASNVDPTIAPVDTPNVDVHPALTNRQANTSETSAVDTASNTVNISIDRGTRSRRSRSMSPRERSPSHRRRRNGRHEHRRSRGKYSRERDRDCRSTRRRRRRD